MKQIAEVYGLVLAGGKSIRMGQDKGLLQYHKKPQRLHIFDTLHDVCANTFMSLRKDQENVLSNSELQIVDENRFKGPFNGLLSAHHRYPEVAWLVIACDIPLMDRDGLTYLLKNRDPKAVATALTRTDSELPEPLVAIWEPHGLSMAKDYLDTSESSCPRKFLLTHNCKRIKALSNDWLENANAPEDFKKLSSKLSRF